MDDNKKLEPKEVNSCNDVLSSEPHVRNETREVIKYLKFCVHRLQNEDPGVHNLLLSLSLYAKQSVEGMKLVFVELDQATSDPEGCATRKIVEDVDKLVSCLVNKLAEIFDSSLTGASSRSCEHVLNVVMQEGKIWLRSAGDGFDCAYFWGVWMFLTFGRKLRLEMGIDSGTLGCLQFFFTFLPANMVYVTSWDDFVEKSVQLFPTDPESIIPSTLAVLFLVFLDYMQWDTEALYDEVQTL